MPEEWILGLTVAQFNARLQDVFEIHNHFEGGGKGRITREAHDSIKRKFKDRGLNPPEKVADK